MPTELQASGPPLGNASSTACPRGHPGSTASPPPSKAGPPAGPPAPSQTPECLWPGPRADMCLGAVVLATPALGFADGTHHDLDVVAVGNRDVFPHEPREPVVGEHVGGHPVRVRGLDASLLQHPAVHRGPVGPVFGERLAGPRRLTWTRRPPRPKFSRPCALEGHMPGIRPGPVSLGRVDSRRRCTTGGRATRPNETDGCDRGRGCGRVRRHPRNSAPSRRIMYPVAVTRSARWTPS